MSALVLLTLELAWAQASFLISLNLLGINLMPLATAGLGSGVVLGFASQSVLANVVAGCNLVSAQPACWWRVPVQQAKVSSQAEFRA